MRRLMSLVLAIALLFSTIPTQLFAMNNKASEELQGEYLEERYVNGKHYFVMPVDSVALVKDNNRMSTKSYKSGRLQNMIAPASITPNVPTENGAGHLINAAASIIWQAGDWDFPTEGIMAYLVPREGPRKAKPIAEVLVTKPIIMQGQPKKEDLDKCNFQFKTNENYVAGDEKEDLFIVLEVKIEQNVRVKGSHSNIDITNGTGYWFAIEQKAILMYTSEWYDNNEETRPKVKGWLKAPKGQSTTVDLPEKNKVFRNAGNESSGYIDELDMEGNKIGFLRKFDKVGNFDKDDLNLGKGQTLKADGKFVSYVGTKGDVNLDNKSGKTSAFSKMVANEETFQFDKVDYPAYFYFLVGDNNHMWRFQMREVLKVKFNSGAGSLTKGGETKQDIGTVKEMGHSEKITGNVSGREVTIPAENSVVPPKAKKDGVLVDTVLKGWATKPQTLVNEELQDGEGSVLIADKNGALTNEGKEFKFTDKETIFYAVFETKNLGSVNIKYVTLKDGTTLDDKLTKDNTETIPVDKLTGLKTTAKGQVGSNVANPFEEGKAPEIAGYTFKKLVLQDAKYAEENLQDIYVVYEAEKIADKYNGKLDPKDIKVWVEDDIDWKKGVKVKGVAEDSDENKALKAELDKANAKVEDLGEGGTKDTPNTARNSKTQNLPKGKKGNLLVTFADGSTLVVNDQTLYVADKKVEEKDPKDKDYINPDNLPDDKVKVEIKLGEGVKEAKQDGKKGNAANPVVIKTYYVKPNTGLEAGDFPTTTGKNAEIVKDTNYLNNITWTPSDLTKIFAKGETGSFVASAVKAVCKDKKVVKAEFEKVIDPMFENIKKKDGVYLGKYDKENKTVTVAIMDKTQGAKQLTGTGLATGLENLYKNNNLIKIKVGTQDERDLRDLAKSQPSSGMTLQQLFATVFGADVLNEVQLTGTKTGTLADFIGKSVTLKLTVQEPNCDGNAVELTYTIEGKEAVSSILKDKLSPQDIKVWKKDPIDWEKGVKKDENGLTKAQKEQIKDEFSTYDNDGKKTNEGKAKFEDQNGRKSDTASTNPFIGNIKVTFSDGSELLVENQNLYVSDHVTGKDNNNAPADAITVQFLLGNGVKAKKGNEDVEGPKLYETYKVKPGTNLDEYKFVTNQTIFDSINPESMNPAKFKNIVWTPTNHVATKTNNKFTATATESFIMKHTFKLLDKDNKNAEISELPQVLKDKLAKLIDKEVAKGKTYKPENLAPIKEVKEADNNFYDYTFVKWEPEEAKDEDKTFVGTWTREQSTSKKPIINPVKPEDKNITGKGVPGSEIEVTIPGVKDPIKTTVDQNGDWTVKVPEDKKLKTGEEIVVTQKELGKKPNSDNTKVGEEPKPEPQPQPMPTPEYNPWWPIWFGSTKTEAKPEPKHLERHEEYIAGYPDGTVRPDGKITRAEVSAIFARLTENSAPANYSSKFSDVLAYDWFCDSVMKLSNKDIIKGYPDGTFKPNKSITRAEFAVIASKYIKNPKAADETFSDVPMNHWAKDAIAMVKAEGWISGYTDGTFKPDAPITRAEAVSIVNRMFDRAADGEFVREHGFEIKKFNDLTDKHWAYYEIMEAVHTHDYERIDKRTERWDKIVK